MNPIDWLTAQAPGFGQLSDEERQAIMHFALLWSFFEARVLQNSASANAIQTAVQNGIGKVDLQTFQEPFAYFRDRYFQNNNSTSHFDGLHFRANDKRPLVEAVLNGTNQNPVDFVTALLLIVWRLRNNLFHGVKWAYGIHDQLGNFINANTVLMNSMDLASN